MNAMLTPEEIAERLKVSPVTVYKYLSPGGPLHHLRIKIGGTVRVNSNAFEQYLQREQTDNAAAT